ncbi:unnamed protein product [Candida verbasci]|uniref:Uncharacterized protein n=1 Tax=Candida verbasci TaxID=1227364 RepID=A0A9W4X9U5_9ASCO|nr:unnamed protein product [Candida verbasci]
MSDEYLHSSPQKEDQSNIANIQTQTPASKKTAATSTLQINRTISTSSIKQNPPPSASKFINQTTNFSGWTPLISKCYNSEQILSFNSTPNVLNKQQQQIPQESIVDLNGGCFGLTPFINTPYEKIFHQQFNNICDFYIESPIKNGNNTNLQTITPSKFNLSSVAKSKSNNSSIKTKRSITLVDTPPRRGAKSNKTHTEEVKVKEEKEEEEDEKQEELEKVKENASETPCKSKSTVLRDVTNNSNQFQTPAKQKLHAPSSPSTIIISSPVKNDSAIKTKNILGNNNSKQVPPSPTPAKKVNSVSNAANIPMMGVFTEKKESSTTTTTTSKPKPKPKKKVSHNNNDNHSNHNASNNISFNAPPPVNVGKNRADNKVKMQQGMSKFQIVLTDVHNLMNPQKPKKTKQKQPQQQPSQSSHPPVPTLTQQHSNLDSSMNTTKDHSHSSIISNNVSHIHTTQSSFEVSSTPNNHNKFLLDKISPNDNSFYSNVTSTSMAPPQKVNHVPQQQGQPQVYMPQQQPIYPFMSMTMSTPQHQNIIYNNNMSNVIDGSGLHVSPDVSYGFGTPGFNSIFNLGSYSKNFDDSIG